MSDRQAGFKHKKSLGQVFLKDPNIARKIAGSAGIEPGSPVWEVGPGGGILTRALLDFNPDLTVFEIDRRLWENLEKEFSGRIRLVPQDILRADWQALMPESGLTIVSNLPYQITSPFLFRTLDFAPRFRCIVIMIQREVALRMKSGRGTADYGALSLKMQFHYKVEYLFTVEPHVFFPPPNVRSAVVRLTPRPDVPQPCDPAKFWRLVDVSFGHRRKMLRKCLENLLTRDQIDELGRRSAIELTRRGETLDETEFLALHRDILGLDTDPDCRG